MQSHGYQVIVQTETNRPVPVSVTSGSSVGATVGLPTTAAEGATVGLPSADGAMVGLPTAAEGAMVSFIVEGAIVTLGSHCASLRRPSTGPEMVVATLMELTVAPPMTAVAESGNLSVYVLQHGNADDLENLLTNLFRQTRESSRSRLTSETSPDLVVG